MSVKICGCRLPADAACAAEAGASHIGLVFAERLRRVTPDEAARIVKETGGAAVPVGVFVDAPEAEIRGTADRVGLSVAQLHGSESPETCDRLRTAGLGVWKAIRPRARAELLDSVDRYRAVVDAILLEGFSHLAVGGTGTAFPHEWLDALADGSLLRAGMTGAGPAAGVQGAAPALVLAGGLTPDNVAGAIRHRCPAIVDVSSGVERAPGEKDPDLIRRFVTAALEAFAELERGPVPSGGRSGNG